ncbi:MAG: lipocalin family protein [Candidatus Woesearchaeota archaeon]
MKGAFRKRFLHLSDKLLETIEEKELKLYKKFPKNRLDPIKKKKLSFPNMIYPLEKAPAEWWYFTGHVNNLGYEFCIFKFHPQVIRLGVAPLSLVRKKPFLVFHFTITDKKNKKFYQFRDVGVKQQQIHYDHLELALNNTSLIFKKGRFQISTKNKLAELKLNLKPLKKVIKHFDHGFKIVYPKHRTYYLSFSRLETTGSLTLHGKKQSLHGVSWFDHQKVNFVQKSEVKGWDWFSVIFDDGTELMFYGLRLFKNKPSIVAGTFIDQRSGLTELKEISIRPLSYWTSPKTKITYPSGWKVEIPELKASLTITPQLKNQELTHLNRLVYWEGACDVSGKRKNKVVKGKSYVELVGYDQRFLTKLLRKNMD